MFIRNKNKNLNIMRNRIYILVTMLMAFMLQGCFIFQTSSSSEKSTTSTSSNSSYVSMLCSHKWGLTQGKAEEYVYDNNCNFIRSVVRELKNFDGSTHYVRFYTDNTCVEYGLWGGNGNKKRTWSLKGNKLTIYGQNLIVGELTTNSATFTIESINNNYLQIKRSNGSKTCESGSEFFKTLYFK